MNIGYVQENITRLVVIQALLALYIIVGASSHSALAAGAAKNIERQNWTFSGPFGTYDRAQLQRGFQVYREVCAACHGLSYIAFRNLSEPGGPEFLPAQAKTVAGEYIVIDGPDDLGDMFERQARLSDRFPSPYQNENAARASNGGAYPPDLSLIAKARAASAGFPGFILDALAQYQEYGPDYIYNLLTGYDEPPEGLEVPAGQYYNSKYLAGDALAMAPPLIDEIVEYTDGTPMTVDQYSRDISAFLMWAAEPHLETRKKMGVRVIVFMGVFAVLLYFTNKKLWRGVKAGSDNSDNSAA